MNYNKLNNLFGWLCAFIATTVYAMTVEPTTSFWDTGEFIAAAYKMQIVHQPGAPLFLMLQNVFSILAFGDVERIAYWMNMGSAVSSGFTILFLFWTITALARKVLVQRGEMPSQPAIIIQIIGAGVVGALAYTFSDTFWFSAVESEVYAMSSLCTAVVVWAIFKWDLRADESDADRWLIFIAYIMGLSIGVHLLNLLAIPALALVIYFRKTANPTNKGILKALLIGCVIVAVVLWGIIQYLIKGSAYFDLFFVNTLGMGFGTGVFVFGLLLVGGITYGIWYSIKKNKHILNVALLSLAFIVFGYSSFTMVLIRAKADPTLNNSDPDNAFAFLSYLNREQYGNEPKFVGPYFDSNPIALETGGNVYRKGEDKYVVADQEFSHKFDRETIFPRIYSNRDGHPQFYRSYLNLAEGQKPTFGDNLNFFFSYQIGHMYGRYFMWNFAGRQNDQQGHGDFTSGNWISGIKPIDNLRLGGQYALPDAAKDDVSRNQYFFLPFLLGLLGAFWHFRRQQKDAGVIALLFFFTGLAIVLYLNQSPLQPRERDYAYAGSFYAFSIWIGLGVIGLSEWLNKKMAAKQAALIAGAVSLLAVPLWMAKENWDDHDRSQKYVALDFARNYLESCAPNAILFTYGDNDTYPLWYAQEVEGIRTDIRLVNLSLLGSDWYMRQMTKPVNDAAALPLDIPESKYVKGVRDVLYYSDAKIPGHVDIHRIVDLLLSDNSNDKLPLRSGKLENFLPTQNFQLKIDKEAVIRNKVVPEKWQEMIADTIRWKYNKTYLTRTELSILAVLSNNNWERPIYFTATVPSEFYMGLDKYMVSEGWTLRLMPIEAGNQQAGELVHADAVYDHIKNKYKWGNMNKSPYLDPETYRMLSLILNTVYSKPASVYIEEGNIERAKEILYDALENMPPRLFRSLDSYGYSFIVENLYQVGDTEKARELIAKNQQFLSQQLDYYVAIAETKPNLEVQSIREALFILNRFAESAEIGGDKETANQLNQLMTNYQMKFGVR
jgi:tetratricopeptide (TPR) repeat protein